MKKILTLAEIKEQIPDLWDVVRQAEFFLNAYQQYPALRNTVIQQAISATADEIETHLLASDSPINTHEDLLSRYETLREVLLAAKDFAIGETRLIWDAALTSLDQVTVTMDINAFLGYQYQDESKK